MEDYTLIQIHIPPDFDYKLDVHLAKLKMINAKLSKEKLILKLAMIGFLQEDKSLTEYLK